LTQLRAAKVKDDKKLEIECPRCQAKIEIERERVIHDIMVRGRVDCADCPWQDYVIVEVW